MQVKTFEGFSIKEAVKAVRTEFGTDAVILKTKERPVEGGSGKVYEVTAAIPESRGAGAYHGGGDSKDFGVLKKSLDNLEYRVSFLQDNIVTKDQVHAIDAGLHELRIFLLECLKDKEGFAFKGLDRPLQDLLKKLQVMGVDETRLAEMVKALKSIPVGDGEDAFEFYQSQAIRWMLKKVKIAARTQSLSDAASIQIFVGGTGVGKTAMVAKLAGLHHLKEKRKVLVVSYDNVRLAAAEQMRVFAKVIGVPFETINQPKDLEEILGRYKDVEMVFVDTSGRSPKVKSHIEPLMGFKNLNLPVDFHLVLSLTEKEDQLDKSVRSFAPLGISSVAFTKLDETWSYGQIFNVSARWSIPISFFGTGQRMPEDVERATRERVVERIFGL